MLALDMVHGYLHAVVGSLALRPVPGIAYAYIIHLNPRILMFLLHNSPGHPDRCIRHGNQPN